MTNENLLKWAHEVTDGLGSYDEGDEIVSLAKAIIADDPAQQEQNDIAIDKGMQELADLRERVENKEAEVVDLRRRVLKLEQQKAASFGLYFNGRPVETSTDVENKDENTASVTETGSDTYERRDICEVIKDTETAILESIVEGRLVLLEHTDDWLDCHPKDQCKGEHCTVHNRSDHHMRHMRQHWRGDRGIMERICEHGVGHPDPDDYRVVNGEDGGVHGCCGICCIADPQDVTGNSQTRTAWKTWREVAE